MNATTNNATRTAAVSLFGLEFPSASLALQAFGWKYANPVILGMNWQDEIRYWEQDSSLRNILGETVLVRDMGLTGATLVDGEALKDFYFVEGKTLDGNERIYAVRFIAQEEGPAREEWTPIPKLMACWVLATDADEDERAVVMARTACGKLFVSVTSVDRATERRQTASRILDEESKIEALESLQF